MRIGIDLQVLNQKHLTGVPKYALNITRALLQLGTNHQWVLFVPDSASPLLEFLPTGGGGKERGKEGKGEIIALPRKRIPFLTAHWQYARIMQKAKLDVLFGPANAVPWFYSTSPALPSTLSRPGEGKGRGRTVITLHDLAIYKHPEWFPKGQWFSKKILVPSSIKKAQKIIVPSQATKQDLEGLFPISRGKIEVIAHGVEERFFTPSFSPLVRGRLRGGDYILFVGALEPRKNVARLIEAYQMLPDEIRAKYELWIGGEGGLGSEKLKVESGKLKGKIRFLGYVPDEDLPAFYQGAAIFVYPSLYEGFGLPVLEAMAAGRPVITSKGTAMEDISTSSLPSPGLGRDAKQGEVEALVLVDPTSPQEIASAITRLIRDGAYSRQISRAGRELAHNFIWERAAAETLKALEGSVHAEKSLV